LNEALRFVRESPVNGWTQKALNDTTATGDAALQLALRVPLDRPGNTTVKGGLTLTGHEYLTHDDVLYVFWLDACALEGCLDGKATEVCCAE
jgi:uncharacterized protein YhdP